MISILAPSRGRPEKSVETFKKWMAHSRADKEVEFILSLDEDDDKLYIYDQLFYGTEAYIFVNKNRSAVDAINNAAKIAKGDVLMVVSDDTEPCDAWIEYIYHEANGKTDWIMKTQDGIQPWIITMPVMDRAYYNRTGYIYHPDFEHMFCDTYATCVADISGRKITSDLLFPHLNDSIKDDLRKKTDGTWKQGEETFIRLMKQFSREDIQKIKDRQMIRWLRNKGVQV